jgi:hypothetical protein
MMEDRLVQDVEQILLLLLKGKTNVNTIIKQTSIYKNRVFNANKFLEKAKLAHKIKDRQVHEQKKYLELNEFGQELANFIENTEEFEKSLEQLKNNIKQIYYLPQGTKKKTISSLLLNRGLSPLEISTYRDDLGYAEDLGNDSLSVLLDGIVNKYALFLLEFSPNSYAKEFLKEIIIRRLSKYLLLKVESMVRYDNFRCEKCGMDLSEKVTAQHRIKEMTEENGLRLFNFLEDYVHIPFNNRHISNEVKDIVSCLFSVFHLPKDYVEWKIEENIEVCKNASTNNLVIDEAQAKRNIESQINYLTELKALA